MSWWKRVRCDLAKPERSTGRDEAPFLAVSALVLLGLAQLSDPGTVGEVLFVLPAVLAVALRPLLPRVPSEAFAVITAVPVGLVVARDGSLEVTFFLSVLMTLYAAWHLGSTTRAALTAAIGATSPLLVLLLSNEDLGWTAWVSANVFTFALGRGLQRQRELIEQLEAARGALAARAVAEERRRIARELHDLAGHTLAAMLLHVTGARHVLRRDLDEAERALLDAEGVGRASLDQIRSTVAALRSSERGTDPSLASAADVDGLVEEYRRAGLAIDATIAPDAALVDGPVGTAVHRICREALANVARHAPANHVVVTVDLDGAATDVRIAVHDRGTPPRPVTPGAHFGIVGMRERARALGGDLDARPTDDGWSVDARLPLAGSDPNRVAVT